MKQKTKHRDGETVIKRRVTKLEEQGDWKDKSLGEKKIMEMI